LEVLPVLLGSRGVLEGKAENTIEYSAEKGGLLGSQDIFLKYEKTTRDDKAIMQQDMTDFVYGTIAVGKKPEFGSKWIMLLQLEFPTYVHLKSSVL
jgi:leucyl aminopeptidase